MNTTKCNLEIVRTLGVGGMATVYLARRDEGGTSRVVAVKKPHAFLVEDPATMAVLEDEARLGACIRHPNVVGVIDFVGGDEPALVMEWVDGVELGKLVRAVAQSGRRLPVDVVAAIACDVLAGLHAAHESRRADGLALDVVHRDVSPQNVLVGFDGSARITDFGVAKAACREQHTEQGSIKGKLRYLAPEQLTGACDRRADVFGVGAVVWELLTGERMRSGSGVEMLVEILCAQVQAPGVTAPEAACLDAVVMRALERSPEERFATAAEMFEAIERCVGVASAERVAEVVRALVGGAGAVEASVVEQSAAGAMGAVGARGEVGAGFGTFDTFAALEAFDGGEGAYRAGESEPTMDELGMALSSGEYEIVRPGSGALPVERRRADSEVAQLLQRAERSAGREERSREAFERLRSAS
jgi:serine/threonine-protein kinase